MYLNKLLKECNLANLMDRRNDICKQIQSLDSEMQTLVYENYNKFISATDTIRKMKNDFKKMEDEMDGLATNMESITKFSGTISNTLQDRRQQINKLSGVHVLLRKLQFLFELPAKLKECIEMEAYVKAVSYYVKAQQVLEQYQHMPSFQGIQNDCFVIISDLKEKLRDQFKAKEATPKQIAESIELLLKLKEPAEVLCDEFLEHARQKLNVDLAELDEQVKLISGEIKLPSEMDRPADAYMKVPMDILEYVDLGCNGFLGNICLIVASYSNMFVNRPPSDEDYEGTQESQEKIAHEKLIEFVTLLMEMYFTCIRRRVKLERDTGDNTILVRALDRFYRRLQAMNKLLPATDFSKDGMNIVMSSGKDRCSYYLQSLKQHFKDCITDIRQTLAAPKIVNQETMNTLSDLLNVAMTSVANEIKSILSNLQAFIQPDITFASNLEFHEPFCLHDVREGLVVAFFQYINKVSNQFCKDVQDNRSNVTPSPTLLLVLSRFCLDMEASTISYILALVDEKFLVDIIESSTPVATLCSDTKKTAQVLLNHFVQVQGLAISQMLRKSVDTRDWLNTIEPRNVRAVMKRVVEDVTLIDGQVGQLYEEGSRKERSSDSSRRTFHSATARLQVGSGTAGANRAWSSYGPSSIDNSLMSNIQRLFSERIEIFSTVELSKVSVLTGIVKIALKTFLECVRLRTFGKFGLQQLQVDTHYLQLYLWRFVSDENLVHFLLDEILTSCHHRCLDPVLMEPSVVELICERG